MGDSRNDLTYTYQGNILTGVNNNGTSYTYSHDGNGNRSVDGRKGVNISYNVLNLPDKVRLNTSANTEKAAFVYLADGTSVGMFAHLTGTTYAGNLTMGTLTYTKYPSLVVQGAEFAAGRINASSGGVGTDVWYYTRDHLGSTRLITDANGAVKERSDYYPFGLRMEGGTQASGNRWRFAGKEEQKAGITLDWLNFGARMYDPCLGRWTTQDPLAEKYPGISPYAYCAGNPMNLVDPDGRDIWGLSREKGIMFLEANDEQHQLVVLDEKENRTSTVFTMENDDVFRLLVKRDAPASYAGKPSESHQLLGLFFFLSDNSSHEWAFHQNQNQVVLGGIYNKDSAGSWSVLGMKEKPSFSIHSHPDISPRIDDEYFSMGMVRANGNNQFTPILGYDWDNMQQKHDQLADKYLIYFPNSGRFYRIAYPNKVISQKGLFEHFR